MKVTQNPKSPNLTLSSVFQEYLQTSIFTTTILIYQQFSPGLAAVVSYHHLPPPHHLHPGLCTILGPCTHCSLCLEHLPTPTSILPLISQLKHYFLKEIPRYFSTTDQVSSSSLYALTALCNRTFTSGVPTPTSTSPWPVRNQAAQQDVSKPSFICIYSCSPLLALPPELHLLSSQWQH